MTDQPEGQDMPKDGGATARMDELPDATFPVVEICGTLKVKFTLRNPDEHTKAKRCVEAVKKLFADTGAAVEIQFDGGQ